MLTHTDSQADPLTGHRWEHERMRGRRSACAMPAAHRRRCVQCGLVQFKSAALGSDYQDTNRPLNPCRQPD